MASNFRVIDEFRKDQEGSGCGLIWGTAPTICLEVLRKVSGLSVSQPGFEQGVSLLQLRTWLG